MLYLSIATPRDLNFNDVKDALQAVDGVKEVHNLRLWSLTTNKTALSAHLAIGELCKTLYFSYHSEILNALPEQHILYI